MDEEYIKNVKLLLETNSIRQTAKILGVDKSTISYWLKKDFKCCRKERNKNVNLITKEYSFILGFYLGDGTISKHLRTYKLRLFNTKSYENINTHLVECLNVIFPENKCNQIDKPGCWEIGIYNKNLPTYFPQVGSGMKHERLIELSEWQKEIVSKFPNEFIKGLIYSDGSIVYSGKYKRYEFSNRSLDIHDILSYALELIGVEKTSTRRKSPKQDSDYYNQYITTISKTPYVDILSNVIADKS